MAQVKGGRINQPSGTGKKQPVQSGQTDSKSGRTGIQHRPPSEAIRTAKPSGVSAGAGANLSRVSDTKTPKRAGVRAVKASQVDSGNISDTAFKQKFARRHTKEITNRELYPVGTAKGRKAHDTGGMTDLKAGTIKPRGTRGRKKTHG